MGREGEGVAMEQVTKRVGNRRGGIKSVYFWKIWGHDPQGIFRSFEIISLAGV